MRRKFLQVRTAQVFLISVSLFIASHAVCNAEWSGWSLGSFLPLNAVETVIGPIIPPCGIGNTFRSEVGTGLASASLRGAKIKGSQGDEFDLRQYANLDRSPLRMDVFANLRVWRFGLRGNYWNFDTRSKHRDFDKVELTGLIVGGDVDLVQREWLAIGAQADFYLLDPRFQGLLRSPSPLDPTPDKATFRLQGDKPVTVGPYLRYIPPEILGWPVHLEAFYKIPIKGASLNSVGARLVFRPQIYRFDIAMRLLAEQTWIKFRSDAKDFQQISGFLPPQEWRLDMEWRLFGVDLAVYF
ncbi:MAG: hypothetical protein FJY85_10030 [Deltaproteobacteria bacterium]|nr:hypothetical protein [Deltaproteobacteria bacterium]